MTVTGPDYRVLPADAAAYVELTLERALRFLDGPDIDADRVNLRAMIWESLVEIRCRQPVRPGFGGHLDLGTCDTQRKTKYATRNAAQKAATTVANVNGDRRMRAYRCPDCNCWHVAHVGRTT